MNHHTYQPLAKRPLGRGGYALSTAAYFGASVVFGAVLGSVYGPALFADPDTFEQFLAYNLVFNVLAGIYFVLMTYRRALDCSFGQNGFAGIAAVAALPTLAMPNLFFVVFVVMMFFKSAPDDEEEPEFQDDEFPLPPLQSGE